MTSLRFAACTLVATFSLPAVALAKAGFYVSTFAQIQQQAGSKPPVTIVTDQSWDVSGQKVQFGEYPLSAEQCASATSPLHGGTFKAVAAEHNGRSKLVPGAVPIWRFPTGDDKLTAYQFRKTVQLGAEPIRKITLEVNCDDVARIYINQRLVSADKRDGSLRNSDDKHLFFRSVTGFMYDRIYTYDVTDYFFTNVTNTIIAEVNSLAFDASHAYLSAKIVIEFGPMPEPERPVKATAPAKPKPDAKTGKPASADAAKGKKKPAVALAEAGKENTVFEAGRDPEIEKLSVGSILELGHVYFKADDYRLDSSSFRTLDALASFIKRHSGLKIEVGGHTNLRPGDRFATELSTNRARSVVRYLTDNGVAADRVTYKGYGKSQPRIDGVSKDADRVNQRVEVKVLEK